MIGGDFNQELTDPKNKLRPELEKCRMTVGAYQGFSFFRPNMQRGSQLDYIVVSNEMTVEAKSVNMEMSDHNMVVAAIQSKNGTW